MYDALINILSQLPEETKVYCGHEYTLQNLKFAAFVEPYNDYILKKMKWSLEQREKGLPTVSNKYLVNLQHSLPPFALLSVTVKPHNFPTFFFIVRNHIALQYV